jgi:hypothetical protein
VTTRVGSEPDYPRLLEQLGIHRSLTVVCDPPEIADAIDTVEELTRPRRKSRRRFTPAENKAIELWAVELTRRHFKELGYKTEDVGATRSYDVHATKGSEVIKVEVKGTTTGGEAVVLTANEVVLHVAEHTNNALAIVRNIALDRSGEQPSASGGTLDVTMPWERDELKLEPIAYRYSTSSERTRACGLPITVCSGDLFARDVILALRFRVVLGLVEAQARRRFQFVYRRPACSTEPC